MFHGEQMRRYIEADHLKESVEGLPDCYNGYSDTYDKSCIIGLIDEEPTADVVPVVHGHWIYCKGSNGKDYRKCSVCLHTQEITGLLNYCPICGAKMDEVTE